MSNCVNVIVTDDKITLKYIFIKSDNIKLIYSKDYTADDIIHFGIGGLNNFYKICKEVFENNENNLHKLLFNIEENNVKIDVIYSGIFEFKFILNLPFVFEEIPCIEEKINLPIINDINQLKSTVGNILSGIKNISDEIIYLRENQKNIINSNNTQELKTIVELLCNNFSKLEKFIYSEINEIRIVENDNEKIPINCKNLSINLSECSCCTVNKYNPYNNENCYTISLDPKFKLSDNFKLIQCKDLTINIAISMDNYKINILPSSVVNLTLNSNTSIVDFIFMSNIIFTKINVLNLKNFTRSLNFDNFVRFLNPDIICVTESDFFLQENKIEKFGYILRDDSKNEKYKQVYIYEKIILNIV
jgi:hypothetical protein